ncbi:hypothetical protein MSEN_25460 [Mycolicibacter senuensis]|uniref:Uncharacterized protein n=1 Tax=Mycolicibacter senuensis TaxID=386913 RepID=A0A7I9XN30_9MYCO|nr:hypothetical protein MSEN_25460 [Mycolicibacter senuensis]
MTAITSSATHTTHTSHPSEGTTARNTPIAAGTTMATTLPGPAMTTRTTSNPINGLRRPGATVNTGTTSTAGRTA